MREASFMKILKYIIVSLLGIVLNITNIFAKDTKDTLHINLFSKSYIIFDTIIEIKNDNWINYKFNISSLRRDSVGQIVFNPIKTGSDTTILNIDSIVAIGEKDTLLLEDFDMYYVDINLCSQPFRELKLSPERLWEIYYANNGTVYFDQIFLSSDNDSDKYLRLHYLNFWNDTVDLFLYLYFVNWDSLGTQYTMNYLDLTKYNFLRVKLKRENIITGITNKIEFTFKNKTDYFYDAKTNSIVFSPEAYFNITKIELFNLSGKLIYKTNINSNKIKRIKLPSLSNGVYFLSYTFNKDIKIGKFIIM